MDEALKCNCGGKNWHIYDNQIKCAKCGFHQTITVVGIHKLREDVKKNG